MLSFVYCITMERRACKIEDGNRTHGKSYTTIKSDTDDDVMQIGIHIILKKNLC